MTSPLLQYYLDYRKFGAFYHCFSRTFGCTAGLGLDTDGFVNILVHNLTNWIDGKGWNVEHPKKTLARHCHRLDRIFKCTMSKSDQKQNVTEWTAGVLNPQTLNRHRFNSLKRQ